MIFNFFNVYPDIPDTFISFIRVEFRDPLDGYLPQTMKVIVIDRPDQEVEKRPEPFYDCFIYLFPCLAFLDALIDLFR